MKQLILSQQGLKRAGGTALASLLLTFTSVAQSVPNDTLETGYGQRPLNQITERTYVLKARQLNKGIIYSTEQLLTGQIAALRIVPGGGAPGATSDMVLRTGTSIFGNRSPLIVLDGVPLENHSASDFTSPLSFLSPHDIESVTMLKDASSMAVYGGRAADGVLYITTKKGSGSSKVNVDFSSRAGISVLGKKANVLRAGEFRSLINRELPEKSHLLGDSDTDWQEVIYRKAFSHDQHLGIRGTLLNTVPYRISFGHLNQKGILKTEQARRNSLALSLNPSFFQDHLRIAVHLRKTDEKMRLADHVAIGTALAFDPTQPVYEENAYGGYYTYKHSNGTPDIYAMRNPLAMLEQRQDEDNTGTLYGHAQLQYRMHFFPHLSLNARYVRMKQNNDYSSVRPLYYGSTTPFERIFETRDRKLDWDQKEAFLAYDQSIEQLSSRIRLVTGAVVRENSIARNNYPIKNEKGQAASGYSYSTNTTRSETLYGQFSILFKDRYLIETSFAKDNSSYFTNNEAPNLTGSAGASWDIAKENFLSASSLLSSLRLFTNYGNFLKPLGESVGAYPAISPGLRPEKTSKWNAGVSWGVLNNRITGDINYYRSKTSDMLLHMVVSSGSGYRDYLINGGSFNSSGFESTLSYELYNRPDFRWKIGVNLATLQSEVSDLGKGFTAYVYGDQMRVLQPGKPINSFYLFEQQYDAAGKPIENRYTKGPNGYNEKQGLESSDPAFLFGISSETSYRKLSAGFLLRGSTGNYVFNAADAYRNALYMADAYSYLQNIPADYAEAGFRMRQSNSSHFMENASFLRMEYLQLTYDLGNVLQNRANLRLNTTVQNAFVLTKYKGQDPEVYGGIDRNQHPHPRTFSLGLNLSI